MAAFPDIFIDPYLVCLPRDCNTVEELDSFVENLLAWADLLKRENVNSYFPMDCLQALFEENLYPYGHEFKRTASRLGSEHLADDFVCRVAQSVLERTPRLEERCSIQMVLFDEASCRVEPDVYVTRLGARIAWGFKHGLAIVACFEHHNAESVGFAVASAISDPEHAFEDQEIHISARVDSLDCQDMTSWGALLPLDINHTIPVVFSRASMFAHMGWLKLWGRAESVQEVTDAIDARVEELFKEGTGTRGEGKTFQIGKRFLDSVKAHSFGVHSGLAAILIDSCARIVISVPKKTVNPFRVSEESDEQRQRTDGALAYRTHLTKSGAGFRLMFWELKNGTIEFANVGTKSELEIF